MTTQSVTVDNDFYTIADSCLLSPYDIDAARLQQVFGQIFYRSHAPAWERSWGRSRAPFHLMHPSYQG